MNQGSLFLGGGEGDAYFGRNESKLNQMPRNYWFDDVIKKKLEGLTSALEIGCSDGGNLRCLESLGFTTLVGIDPSRKAIQNGILKNPQLDLRVGLAEDLPIGKSESFEMVLFGFCLYLVDRRVLLKSLSLADSALEVGGVLAIIDFDVDKPTIQNYTHREGLSSYKLNYASIYEATGEYKVIAKSTIGFAPMPPLGAGSIKKQTTAESSGDYVALWLLRKEPCYA